MAVVNPTAAGESNEVDLSDKLATREVPPNEKHQPPSDLHTNTRIFCRLRHALTL